ncbi:2-oxoglutarate dehydrogenase E1 component [Candidatus Levibacter sp. Uisw_134_01]|uniref:2-oxoglutarate dehydrogenase E1 component n=1 Tax=Candidatus Levibacter sp. Uisw_134_01 TaxID=3230999 RepID=UPI003D4D3BF1
MNDQNIDQSFLSGANATFINDLHKEWKANPNSVPKEWDLWFKNNGDDVILDDGPSWAKKNSQVIGAIDTVASVRAVARGIAGKGDLSATDLRAATTDSIRAIMLIRAFRINGHLLAKLDPLNLQEGDVHPELNPKTYGFKDDDWDRPIFIDNVLGMESATLRQIMEIVKETYCGSIGIEFMHVQDPAQKAWIQERIESIRNTTEFTKRGKKAIYERLVGAETFEQFLHKKYAGTKRFGLDGSESVVPAIEQILKRGSQLGMKEVVIAMAHRGRLNLLYNILNKPFRAIISEFLGNQANPEEAGGSGDVKYHMGASADREFDGNNVHLSLQPNPSHLEVVAPVVIGRVRAKQNQHNDTNDRLSVLGIVLHGDAAFAGQGVVAETFDFSGLRGYRTGGTIHIVVNNQIGFTTSPNYSRSSPYCTDVAKMVMAPIMHINGDDPEAVIHASRIATEFRQKFACDVVLDIISYRRYGHNEGDEPAFTQPIMYKKIGSHDSISTIYGKKLVKEGILTDQEAKDEVDNHNKFLEKEFQAGANYKPNKADWLEGQWANLRAAHGDDRRGETSVSTDDLKLIGNAITTIPENIQVNKKLARIVEARKKAIDTGEGIDWSTAEHLAFGSLLIEGHPVRLSGQDSCRGTFSQRHAVFVDQVKEERYTPLNNIKENQENFEVIDSPLSEASVLGFEYGYSLTEPTALVMWEAQFGDFANGAQVIVDQFISSGEAKWLRMSGLVMLLPHGYEGQGPEHSSARLERYLQLCGEDNMQVLNCSTPANYFHALRRQLKRDFRKPLIIMTPKSLLRNKMCVSKLSDMAEQTAFRRVIKDPDINLKDKNIKKVVICSGKVFYNLYEEREKRKLENVKILRLEQIYPFPHRTLKEELSKTPDAEVVWCQEEPKNMGSWFFVDRKIEDVLMSYKGKFLRPTYAGREEAASPATGSLSRHNKEQADLVNQALTIENKKTSKHAAE